MARGPRLRALLLAGVVSIGLLQWHMLQAYWVSQVKPCATTMGSLAGREENEKKGLVCVNRDGQCDREQCLCVHVAGAMWG